MGSIRKVTGSIAGGAIGFGVGYFVFNQVLALIGPIAIVAGLVFGAGFAFVGFIIGSFGDADEMPIELNDYQKYELQKVASRGKNTTALVALIFPPAGYYLAGKTGIAVFCLLTAHFGTIAHVVAPFHTRRIVKKARTKLDQAAEGG